MGFSKSWHIKLPKDQATFPVFRLGKGIQDDAWLWEFVESEPTQREHEWDWARPPLYMWQLCSLIHMWQYSQWEQGLYLVLWLALGNKGFQGSCSDISWKSWSMARCLLQGITRQNWPTYLDSFSLHDLIHK